MQRCVLSAVLDVSPGVALPGHTEILCFPLAGTAGLLSKATAALCISASRQSPILSEGGASQYLSKEGTCKQLHLPPLPLVGGHTQ